MKYLTWLVFFIPAILVEIFCYVTAPLAALFIYKKPRTDVVKRYNKTVQTFDREYLLGWFYLWQTHDNAADEWWWGVYNVDHWFKRVQNWTQEDYSSSCFVRYYCRLMWLWRNCAYGFHYALFSKPKEEGKVYEFGTKGKGFWLCFENRKQSFQLECHLPIPFTKKYSTINIGWKSHKETEKLFYANRVPFFSFKDYKY